MRQFRPRLRKALDERPGLGRSALSHARASTVEGLPAEGAATLGGRASDSLFGWDAPPQLTVNESYEDGRHTLVPIGALELHSVDVLEAALARLWRKKASAVVLDLREVTFIDSSGLWTITTLQKWCAREAIHFMIIPGPDSVHNVFELTGLSDVLPFVRGRILDGD